MSINYYFELLQETMGNCKDLCGMLSKLLSGWTFVSIDSNGNSWGIITSWRVILTLINSFVVKAIIMVDIESSEL